jgi:hypothetical protein
LPWDTEDKQNSPSLRAATRPCSEPGTSHVKIRASVLNILHRYFIVALESNMTNILIKHIVTEIFRTFE